MVRLLYGSPTAVTIRQGETNTSRTACVLDNFGNRTRNARLLRGKGVSDVHLLPHFCWRASQPSVFCFQRFCCYIEYDRDHRQTQVQNGFLGLLLPFRNLNFWLSYGSGGAIKSRLPSAVGYPNKCNSTHYAYK